MAARTSGFALLVSDICYTLSPALLISLPPVAGQFTCAWLERVAHPVQE
jgi:hypothetical protein